MLKLVWYGLSDRCWLGFLACLTDADVGFLACLTDADVGFMVCLTDADVAPADTAETEHVSVRDAKERPRQAKKRNLLGRYSPV